MTAPPFGGRGRAAVVARLLPVLLPLLLLVGTGVRGLDFGRHWDEDMLIGAVEWSVDQGILLPHGFYYYPSVSWWLCVAGAAPDFLAAARAEGLGLAAREEVDDASVRGVRDRVRAKLWGSAYRLRVRGIFLGVSALALVWVYVLVLATGRGWPEALLAASALGLSWEVAYHLRWIAPDGVLMQFGALTLLFVAVARLRPPGVGWLGCAAAAAGLAAGTKYPGGLLLVPVLLAARPAVGSRGAGGRALLPPPGATLRLGLVFAAAYLVSTPGTLLEPAGFASAVLSEIEHYRTGHVGHTISAGPAHLWRNLEYLSLTLFSPHPAAAAALFLLALAGVRSVWRESRGGAVILLSFPILYLLYMSAQRAMIVRNLLVLAPFGAVLAARGAVWVWERASAAATAIGAPPAARAARAALAILAGVVLVANAVWLVRSAETIRERGSGRFAREAAAYVDAHPGVRFYVSPRVAEALETAAPRPRPNVTREPAGAEEVLLYASEGMDRLAWPANIRGLARRWFGPREVNFDYYPDWEGDDRIVLMSIARAREIGVRGVAEAGAEGRP